MTLFCYTVLPLALCFGLIAATPSAALADTDDAIPGVALPESSPFTGSLDVESDADDVYYVDLAAGQRVIVALYGDEAVNDFDLYLYQPGSTNLESGIVDWSEMEEYPDVLLYRVSAETTGRYYIDVHAYTGSGDYTIEYWVCDPEPDDDVPGVTIPVSPVVGTLDLWDPVDTYQINLVAGQTFHVSLTGASGSHFFPYLFGPGTTDVWLDTELISSMNSSYPEAFDYTVPAGKSGTYYLVVGAYSGYGAYSLSYSITNTNPMLPVYRFYNKQNGSHFYTSSVEERNTVISRWSNVYNYEGVAYSINMANPNNNAPLYRFYNTKNGTHFYTASIQERDTVIVRWPNIYTYEGPVYSVCTSVGPGRIPMYRFYNTRIGSHFYTISADEKDTVIDRWSNVYRYEGVAFWLAL